MSRDKTVINFQLNKYFFLLLVAIELKIVSF